MIIGLTNERGKFTVSALVSTSSAENFEGYHKFLNHIPVRRIAHVFGIKSFELVIKSVCCSGYLFTEVWGLYSVLECISVLRTFLFCQAER